MEEDNDAPKNDVVKDSLDVEEVTGGNEDVEDAEGPNKQLDVDIPQSVDDLLMMGDQESANVMEPLIPDVVESSIPEATTNEEIDANVTSVESITEAEDTSAVSGEAEQEPLAEKTVEPSGSMTPTSHTVQGLGESGSARKKVTFGPKLEPEIFHKGQPASTPLKRGQATSSIPTATTPGSILKSALRKTLQYTAPSPSKVTKCSTPSALSQSFIKSATRGSALYTPLPRAVSGVPATTGRVGASHNRSVPIVGPRTASPVKKSLKDAFRFVPPPKGLPNFYGAAVSPSTAATTDEASTKEAEPLNTVPVEAEVEVPATPVAAVTGLDSPRRSGRKLVVARGIGSSIKKTPRARESVGSMVEGTPVPVPVSSETLEATTTQDDEAVEQRELETAMDLEQAMDLGDKDAIESNEQTGVKEPIVVDDSLEQAECVAEEVVHESEEVDGEDCQSNVATAATLSRAGSVSTDDEMN
ncbi:hypothetical protein HDU99_002087, partial [Rhizoclosmatium hyalinum]